jgi:hypothetical protein
VFQGAIGFKKDDSSWLVEPIGAKMDKFVAPEADQSVAFKWSCTIAESTWNKGALSHVQAMFRQRVVDLAEGALPRDCGRVCFRR